MESAHAPRGRSGRSPAQPTAAPASAAPGRLAAGSEPSSAETAASRRRESVPARIIAHRPHPRRLLDFGCGRSRDVEYYRSQGILAEGHDPHHHPLDLEQLAGTYDLVACTYVLGTLPPGPRAEAVALIRRLLCPGGRLVLSVRDRAEVERERRATWTPEADGWRTHRGTFQRGFEVAEVLDFLVAEGFEQPVLLRAHHGITVEATLVHPSPPASPSAQPHPL